MNDEVNVLKKKKKILQCFTLCQSHITVIPLKINITVKFGQMHSNPLF